MALTLSSRIPIPAPAAGSVQTGSRLEVVGLNQHVGDDHQTLHDVTFTVEPGEVVAIVGGSGAGKTTLLETLVGIRPASSGTIRVDGIDVTGVDPSGSGVGYVPQDDIIHNELPLDRTLHHAAGIRLPGGTPKATVGRIVDEVLARVDLLDRRDVRVRALSGGQRKRASIAVELLTRPHLFYLDEPTSGLDPATADTFMGQVRKLAASGTTIVLTTHNPADIEQADRIVFLARDGHVAFIGAPADARHYFGVDQLVKAYARVASEDTPEIWAARFTTSEWSAPAEPATVDQVDPARPTSPRRAGAVRQWLALTRRNGDLITGNKLTLAILAGSPLMVIGMMAVLFRPGSFAAGQPSPMPAIQTVFWVAFAGFFFGLTYGLLQIVGEMSIFRRERLSGLSVTAYVASKVTVLSPLLVAVAAGMLAVLRALDRLPAASPAVWAQLLVTIVLTALAALTLGLFASAAVGDAAQATLALPMICFPQVLFAGAVVPVTDMAGTGRFMSFGLANRWGFESLGRSLGLDTLVAPGSAAGGYSPAVTGSSVEGWLVLIGMAVALFAATIAVLRIKTRPGRR